MKKAVIFCGGEMDTDTVWPGVLPDDALVICADGGIRHAERLGVVPDVVIGDRDSSERPYPDTVLHFEYPPEKDATDTNLCLDYAMEHGCGDILLLGGLGGRLDHEFSHYSLLLYCLQKGVRARLVNGRNEIWMENRPFTLQRTEKRYVSFFPYGGPVEDFSVRGLKYETEHMTLDCGRVQASSNEFAMADEAHISFRSGVVLVMLCQDLL